MIFEFNGRMADDEFGTKEYAPVFIIATHLAAVSEHPDDPDLSLLLAGTILYEVMGAPTDVASEISEAVSELEYTT